MVEEPHIEVRWELSPEGVGRIVLNRPEVANAVRPSMMRALCDAIDACVAAPAVRALVLTGEGRNFAAGADFGFLQDLLERRAEGVNSDLYTWFKGAVERLWKCPKPTVAAVQGAAITVGCELALACDARVASARSRFGENWLQLGLMPPLGGAVLLPRIVGLTHAKRMVLEAEIIGGEEALRIGLVDQLVDDDAVLARAEARALAMAALPARAFAAAKAALHRGFESTMETEWIANVATQAILIGSDDFRIQFEAKKRTITAPQAEAPDDRAQIRALQVAYGERFDARDPEGFAALYTDDAVLVQLGGKEIRTRDKFAKSVRNMPPRGEGYHRMLDGEVTVESDAAWGGCRFQARSATGADLTGWYEDRYRRTSAGWRFERRAVFLDAPPPE